uniref:PAAR-like domain-containing protein n=1 Tax=Gynuella sp. TaxID=2969146 RepID=UPI003D13F0B3
MSDNILINNRSAVHKDSKGILTTVDVCLTKVGKPVVPIPYTNIAQSKDADKTASSVKINGNPACTKDSVFAKSTGDEAGNRKGIRSGQITGEASFIMGSANVFFEGTAATRAMDLMVSNKQNTPPAPLMQSVGMAPQASSAVAPETLASREGPNHNMVVFNGPVNEDLETRKLAYTGSVCHLKTPQGPIIASNGPGSYYGMVWLEDILTDESPLALNVQETNPWVHKTGQTILVPLGTSGNVPKDENITDADTQLILLQPQRYLNLDTRWTDSAPLLEGWLYIYVNGYLWRELQVMPNGSLREVDLQTWQGTDGESLNSLDDNGISHQQRLGTGSNQHLLELPKSLLGETCEVQVAYSEVQWSWQRIVTLGGMDPEDPRLQHRVQEGETLEQIALKYPAVKDWQTLADLNGLSDPASLQPDQLLQIRPQDESPEDAASLRQKRMGEAVNLEQAMYQQGYVLKLKDPVGLAIGHNANHLEYRQRIDQIISGLRDGNTADPLVNPEANGVCLDPKNNRADKYTLGYTINNLFNRAPLQLDEENVKLDDDTKSALEQLKEAGSKKLDQAYFTQYFQLDTLKQLARNILKSKQDLTEVFDDEETGNLIEALMDYGYLPVENLYKLPKRFLALSFTLKGHPANQFQGLLPDEKFLDELAEQDPGEDLVLRLFGAHPDADPHKLCNLLFPKSTGDGIDDWESMEAPFFNVDNMRIAEELAQRQGLNPDDHDSFDTSKSIVGFYGAIYNQFITLPNLKPGDIKIGSFALLASQGNYLTSVTKAIQSISKIFVEIEISTQEYLQGIFPENAIPVDLVIRQKQAAAHYQKLRQTFETDGVLVTTTLKDGSVVSEPVGAALKRNPISDLIHRTVLQDVHGDPRFTIETTAKVKVLAFLKSKALSINLRRQVIHYDDIPTTTAEQKALLKKLIEHFRVHHKLTTPQRNFLFDKRVDLSLRVKQARILAAELDHYRDLAKLNIVELTKAKLVQEFQSYSGKRVLIHHGYKALFKMMAGVEIWNLWKVVTEKKGVEFAMGLGGSVASLTAIGANIHKYNLQFMYGSFTQNELNQAKSAQVARRTMGTATRATNLSTQISIKKYKAFKVMHAASGIANAFSIYSGTVDTYKAWRRNDEWGMLANGLSTLGAVIGLGVSAAELIGAMIFGTLISEYAILAYLGWAGLALAIAGFLLSWLADTPLEALLDDSPFGKNRLKVKEAPATDWQNWPALVLEELSAFLNTPKIRFYEHTGIPMTNRDFWNAHFKLSLRTPGWTNNISDLDSTLWWRPLDIAHEPTAEWQVLSMEHEDRTLDQPHVDWRMTELEPYQDGSGHLLNIKYEAIYSLLSRSQTIELKLVARYYPKGQNEHFSKAIPEPLALPKPKRSKAPFKAEDAPYLEHTLKISAPRPIDQ